MVNKLLINFTYLRKISVFGFAWETGASRAGNFCCSGRPQISHFFFDNAKVQKIQCASKLFGKKSTQKSTLPEMGGQICYSATVATVKFTPSLSSKLYLYLYIYLYIY